MKNQKIKTQKKLLCSPDPKTRKSSFALFSGFIFRNPGKTPLSLPPTYLNHLGWSDATKIGLACTFSKGKKRKRSQSGRFQKLFQWKSILFENIWNFQVFEIVLILIKTVVKNKIFSSPRKLVKNFSERSNIFTKGSHKKFCERTHMQN